MRVLVVGGGGREHAMAWKCTQSSDVERVFVAPGNAGTGVEARTGNVAVEATDIDGLLAFARSQSIDLTIIGPEAPLVAGIVDRFTAAGLVCLGPGRAAARLEGSKSFSKEFFARYAIPTAEYRSFTVADVAAARRYVGSRGAPIVIKADGLAAGKGVVVARDLATAVQAVDGMLTEGRFGSAGSRVVVEDYLEGEEVSFIAVCDGEHLLPLASSQDHKARDDGDLGPNTGGMGAYSPVPVVTPALHEQILQQVMYPALRGMIAEGTPYQGFLYAGLMILPDGGIRVLEFNCRFGDPESQPILMRLQSDFVDLCHAAATGRLHTIRPRWDPRAALGVVLAAGGYPEQVQSGDTVLGLETVADENVHVFHAGTRFDGGQVVTAGGRVLCVTALGDDVAGAQHRAYEAAAKIHWPGMQYRRDIGYRAVGREHRKTVSV